MLECLNCRKSCSEAEAKLFHSVFVCVTCHTMAESLSKKIQTELQSLSLVLNDRIREALVKGQFHYNEGPTGIDRLTEKDLTGVLSELQKAKRDEHFNVRGVHAAVSTPRLPK